MSKRIVLASVLLAMMVSVAGMSASATDMSEVTAFLYEGLSYLPLKSTASFLGAPLRWDAEKGQAVVTYNGEDFVLTPNSREALYAGQPVVLSSPPVVLNGVTYVPVETFKKYYNVPVEWDKARSEVKIKGPNGWATVKASSRAPWHGSPPPWAPAWGQRGYGTPGHWSNVKADGNAKAKPNKQATMQRGHAAPGHPSNAKPNGNGKVKGNKKDR
jgi:hypothetical protein